MTAIVCFIALVITTLAITGWAARRSQGRSGVYAADGALGPAQNGFAIAGDFLSASTFLGTTALYFTAGVDMILYLAPFLFGLCLMLIWIVGPLRRLGRYTLGDVLAARLPSRGLRIYIGLSTITISIAYLIAQLVGAGMLIAILFGLQFEWAVLIVGVLMTVYVAFGGMLAASWVQIIKAGLLIGTVAIIWVLAVCLGIYEYGRTKGRVGHALTVTLGGGLLATFVAYPQVLMETVPAVFVAIIDWAAGQVT